MTVPSVSVLIDTFNYARFIERAIDSVLQREDSALDVEILVIDDGSTDDTEAVVGRYGRQVRYVRKENEGQASALNLGFQEALGDIICLLDADDFFYPNKIGLVAQTFRESPEVGLVYNEFAILDIASQCLPKTYPEPTWTGHSIPLGRIPAQLEALILLGHPWSCTTSAMSVRRSALQGLQIPEEVFTHSPDLFLGLVLPFVTRVAIIETPETGYVFHGKNVGLFRSSSRNREMFRLQMIETRRYIESRFEQQFVSYNGRSLYGSARQKNVNARAKLRLFLDERNQIMTAEVAENVKRASLTKLAASFSLPDRLYVATRALRASYFALRKGRFRGMLDQDMKSEEEYVA